MYSQIGNQSERDKQINLIIQILNDFLFVWRTSIIGGTLFKEEEKKIIITSLLHSIHHHLGISACRFIQALREIFTVTDTTPG